MTPKNREIEAVADEMAAAGWPEMELHRYGGKDRSIIWTARFDNDGYTAKIQGGGSTMMEAILNAKEKANAR